MLQLQQLTVKRGEQTVIKPLTLSLAAGQLVVVCGPNGCGKSTWLNALAGELPFSGQALWQQHDLARWSGRMRAQQVVMLPQNTPLNFAFSVQEVVALGRLPYNEPAWQSGKLARECLSLVDMHSAAHKAYPALSGGQQQRVQLARILAQLGTEHTAPKLLLLDEPTSALDLAHQHQCLTLAKQRAHSGDLVLVVLHDLNLAARYADQLLLLHQGELVAQGTPAQVLTAEHLYQVYGYRAHCVAAEPPQHFVVY